jgi:hypothetical protein
MSVDISKLKREKTFENEKINISFSTGDVSDSLSVYMKRSDVLSSIIEKGSCIL